MHLHIYIIFTYVTYIHKIIKIDLETKETVLFKEEGSHTSPPIFVPSSNSEVIIIILISYYY